MRNELLTAWLCYVVSLMVATNCINWPEHITIGTISQYIAPEATVATFEEAVKQLQHDSIVPSDINFTFYQMKACDDDAALSAAINLRYKYKVDAFHGPDCSPGAVSAGLFAAFENVPMISDGAVIDTVTNKVKYNTFARVSYTAYPTGEAVVKLLIQFNWTSIAIVRSRNQDTTSAMSGVYGFLKRFGVAISVDLYADSVVEYKSALDTIRDSARIVIVCFGFGLDNTTLFLKEAFYKNMINPDYGFILPWFGSTGGISRWEDNTLLTNLTFVEQLQYFKNSMIIRVAQVYNIIFFDTIAKKLNRSVNAVEINMLMQVYDVMYLYGLALNKTIAKGDSYRNGTDILENMRLVQFVGASGNVTMNSIADRLPDYVILRSIGQSGTFAPFMNSFVTLSNGTYSFNYHTLYNPQWNTTDGLPPKAVPDCGFQNELCLIPNYSTKTIAITVSSCSIVVIFCVIFCLHRKRKKEERLIYMSWKIDVDEVKDFSNRESLSVVSISESGISYKSVMDRQAIYKGNSVYVKRWKKKNMPIRLNREYFLFLKQLRDINDNNLNRFVGANFDSGPDIFILWSFSVKGSLKDILFNDHIQLDMVFKSSLMNDIVLGLEFLHKSPIHHHDSLYIDNCLVGRHWDVKLTNFGMHRIISGLKSDNMIDNDTEYSTIDNEKIYHTAPEILRSSCHTSKMTDIYSLAIVFYQILYRVEPYSNLNLKPQEIIIDILKGLRPSVESRTKHDNDPNLLRIIRQCWNDDPNQRPYIGEIKRNMSIATKRYGKTLIDHVLSVLEKYANNLEKLVEERTQQLLEERRKADMLLYRMLPKTIADCLKRGEPVVPESYQLVTVYFSDIVGFTSLCNQSTSLEVVTFLNLLYSGFDHLMSFFDVYKVETIGDAYMVVSGLPQRNGLKHVTEISDMALSILKLLERFDVPHLPERKIQCRIGIHSGPVASGVVGLKMPKFEIIEQFYAPPLNKLASTFLYRFCLFGDTVNFASRMESSGVPGKIQISESSATYLTKTLLYEIEPRGTIQIKGKGMHKTFWLLKKLELNDNEEVFN